MLMGFKSPVGRDERNYKPKATAVQRCIVGRKLKANVGLDEQESDSRPVSLGKEAIDSDAQYSFGSDDGKSGEAQQAVLNLTPGGLQSRRSATARVQGYHVREVVKLCRSQQRS